jgi:Domain of unknown function DUF11
MRTRTHGAAFFLVFVAALVAGGRRASAQDTATHSPRLSVTILREGIDSRSLIAPGQTVTISIGVSNLRGDQAAHDTVLTVLLPPGLTLKQSRPKPDQSVAPGDPLTWKLGTVDAGAFPQLFDLDLQATSEVTAGQRLGVAALVSARDQQPSDEATEASMIFLIANAAANLILDSNLAAVPFTTDGPVEFTVQVTNLGTVSASACVLKMIVPAKATFNGSDPGPSDNRESVVSWQIGAIAPAESRTVNVKVTLDDFLRAAAYGFAPKLGSLNFEFDATTTTNVFDPDNGHMEIERYPEPAGSNVTVSLNVVGTANPGELRIGKDATIEVIYGNFGSAVASKTKVSLALPTGLGLIGAVPAAVRSDRSAASDPSVVSWDLGDLRVGESGVIRSQIHVSAIGEDGSLVSAQISAEGKDVPSTNKTAYSLQRAANSDAGVAGAWRGSPGTSGGRPARWIFIAVVVLVVISALSVVRVIRRRNLNE